MLNNFENTLIGTIASSVISSSAIQALLPHIKEILDNPHLSLSEEYCKKQIYFPQLSENRDSPLFGSLMGRLVA